MELNDFVDAVVDYAGKCGMIDKKQNSSKGNAIFRKNLATEKGTFKSDAAYFGFIRDDQGERDVYEDYSLVFFPLVDMSAIVVGLGIGSGGIVNDLDIATKPWLRRLFTRLSRPGAKTYFKNDFSDSESYCKDFWDEITHNEIYEGFVKCFKKYRTLIPACEILEFPLDKSKDKDNLDVVKSWIATYAELRGWASSDQKRNAKNQFLPKPVQKIYSEQDIFNVLNNNRFIVLQGAPGTGKTYSTLEVSNAYFKKENVFFEQFHAETTYSDFVYGIRPKLDQKEIEYVSNYGTLLRAIEKAKEYNVTDQSKLNKDNRVLLIIDEINRANLSNVLGPVFYLFEKHQTNHDYPIIIGNRTYSEIPLNLFVIATMNTADRSLAVVDFALRRRFTWLTLKPHKLNNLKNGQQFFSDYFDKFAEFFEKYATDEELNLQPGQSYFIASNPAEMENRLRYELMPLLKEYYNEGFMLSSKDEVSNFFHKELHELMYE